MTWKILSLDDFHFLKDNIHDETLEGSDASLVNIFLLQKKYDTKTAIEGGFLFRYYTGGENRTGYGFPIKIQKCADSEHSCLHDAVALIVSDAKLNGRAVKFCLLTENQKNEIDSILRADFPEISVDWQTNRDDCDYIYSREKLAALQGKTYHKKKNHVSRFQRIYEGNWEFRSLNLCSIADDMIFVAKKWLEERFDSAEAGEIVISDEDKRILNLEHEMIKTALENKEDFALEGGVLYTNGKPVAMTLASRISEKVLDVHFEKCLSEAAANGAYAAINWCFANAADSYEFLNREEDMGVENLRKAKLSYHPDNLLEKFYSV